jgi:hypothetical protein
MSKELEGRELLTAIVDMAEQNRPIKWIARSTGVKPLDIKVILKAAGVSSHDVHDLEKYDRMEYMIQDGASHGEICRTLKTDAKTVNRWFPGTAWDTGGWQDQGGLIRELMRQQREFERTGKIQDNRDAGFNRRKDVL